jgi:alpha-D-xyloside xylohydrolase
MDSTEPDIVNAQTKEAQEYEMKRVGTGYLGSFARYLNTYPLMSTEAVYRNQRKATDRKRVFILTRSVFAGQQRAAATTWSGDIGASWEIFRNQISAGLNHGMSGIPYWTFDIGAYVIGSHGGVFCDGGKDPAYQELYTRMFQLGAFSPIFRSHGSETPREIWEFGVFSEILVKYDRLRYRLMPYIYSLAWKITSQGYTIMRGLPMDFAGEVKTHGIDDQFMFGPALMVSPVTEYMLHRPPEKSVELKPENFQTADGRPGLDVSYFGDDQWGAPVSEGTEPGVNLNWYNGWPGFIKTPKFSMRWVGKLIPTESGPHRFHIKAFGPRILLIDGKQVPLNYQATEAYTVPVELEAGREYGFEFKTSNSDLGAFRAQILWKTPSIIAGEKIPQPRKQTRSVYLPAGTGWTDFWTGRSAPGGRRIETPAPIETLPLMVRAGSIIPMGPFVQYAAEKPADPIELRVYPGADGEFELYEDENDNYNYEKGVYALISIHWDNAGRRLTFSDRKGSYPGMPERRVFHVVLVGPDHGVGVEYASTFDRSITYAGTKQTVQL